MEHEDISNNMFLSRLMSLNKTELSVCHNNTKILREIEFQAFALIFCSISFGVAVTNVAIDLLEYPPVMAGVFGATAAFGLALIDRHYLIQGRGAYQNVRGRIFKIRVLSLLVISLSFMLMTASTFKADIQSVLVDATAQREKALAESPRYKPRLDAARKEVEQSIQMIARRDALRQEVTDLSTKAAQARRDERNECEGNSTITSGSVVTRFAACGPLARGHRAEAERLEQEAGVKQTEFAAIGDPETGLKTAENSLAAIDSAIKREAAIATQGAAIKLDALIFLVAAKPSMTLALVFWLVIGCIPDALMFIAQARMFHNDHFEGARRVEDEGTAALLERLRQEQRQANAAHLAPIDVRVGTQPKLAAANTSVITSAPDLPPFHPHPPTHTAVHLAPTQEAA